MLSKNSTITIDTNWTELEEDFDISSFGLYCTSDIEVQEYGISGWGSSISVSASTSYFKNTSVEKLRVKTLSGTEDLNYSLWGLINYGNQVSSDFNLSDLGDVDDTDKAEGKILSVDSEGNHIYVENIAGTDEKVKYDGSDPLAGYISDKIIAGDGISVSEGTGANENKLVITNISTGSEEAVEYKGTIDASTNPNYPAASKGDLYRISVAGKVGGNSGKDVALSNFILCIADSSTGDEASVGSNWFVIGGDMRKSVYDSDGDGIVDEAEAINDGSNYATAEDIVDSISLSHTQNKDTKLDEGGANEVTAAQAKVANTHVSSNGNSHSSVVSNTTHRTTITGNPHQVTKSDIGLGNVPNSDTSDAISKAHSQNTDTGTSQNNFNVGDGEDTDKSITAINGDANPPKIRYNHTTNKWQYSNNGTTWLDFGTAIGAGDMLQATYDTNANDIVDKAESVNDGTYSATAQNIESAVNLKHSQNTDTFLDSGGANEVTAANAKDAVTKKHSQNTDTGTSGNSFAIGDGADNTKEIIANNADVSKPKIRYNHTTNTWQLSNNGVDFADIQAGAGGGDMLKATYDEDDDGIVDKAESVDDGIHSATAEDIEDAVTDSHTHSNKATLDNTQEAFTTTLKNKLDGIEASADVTDVTNVGNALASINVNALSDISSSGASIEDAVSKKHSQNTDTGTSGNDFAIGDGVDTIKTITVNNGDVNKPKLRYNSSTNNWQYTDDGTNWYNFGVASGGVGSGDMTKATYDSNDNGIVDNSEGTILDTTALTTNLTYRGEVIKLEAAEELVFGDICFIDTDGTASIVDNNALLKMKPLYICLETLDEEDTGKFLVRGLIRNDSWDFTASKSIFIKKDMEAVDYLTETPSYFEDPSYLYCVGIALTADIIYFNANTNQYRFVPKPVVGEGGTIIEEDGYIMHVFTESGTFEIVGDSLTADVLVVAGGGGGGALTGAGGGAGGLIFIEDYVITEDTAIVIGAGGIGNSSASGSNGGNSTFGSLTAVGGGGGGYNSGNGENGGSGGGSGVNSGTAGTGTQPAQSGDSGTYGFGNNGKVGGGTLPNFGAGGGGGAGAASTNQHGGAGKDLSDTFGTNVGDIGIFAGGGGGGTYGGGTPGTGGDGGGGSSSATPEVGQDNTGGGGGGMINNGGAGAAGGSGVVIIRYPLD